MGEGEIVSTDEVFTDWSNVLSDEDSHDKHNTWEWAFGKCGAVGIKQHRVNNKRKEIILNVSKNTNQIYNQTAGDNKTKRKNKLWEILLDSQSTCYVIMNRMFVVNMRYCKWTRRIQTQAGEYRITKITDMK